MRLGLRWMTLGLGLLAPMLGCCHTRTDAPHHETIVLAPELPIVEAIEVEPDPNHLPSFHLDRPDAPPPQYIYRGLSETDCQCLAVWASSMGNLLDNENRAQNPPDRSCWQRHVRGQTSEERLYEFEQQVRALTAEEARNLDAALALTLYFELARAEASLRILRHTREQVEITREEAQKAEDQGVELPETANVNTLNTQLIEIERRLVEGELGVRLLNAELQRRLGLVLTEQEHLWPMRDWHIPLTPLDVNEATAVALAQRAELRLLRYLIQELDEDTLGSVITVLESASGGLIGSLSATPEVVTWVGIVLRRLRDHSVEVRARRAQLREWLEERERLVAEEVRRAVDSLQARAKLVAIARERVEHRQELRIAAEEKYKEGFSSFFEVSAAVLSWHEARADLFEAITNWEEARVQLKRAQGAFVPECGRQPGLPGAGCAPMGCLGVQ